MKKKFPLFILLILPVSIIIISLYFKHSIGEYFLYRDPSYVYLLNSLNLSQMSGYGVGHIDHPGTTLQIIGAIVIKCFYVIQGQSVDIVHDVISRPEFYLGRINSVIVVMISAALYILGITVYKISGNIYSALFLQLTPLCSATIYYDLTNVNPEILLIFSTLLLIAFIIFYLNKDEKDKNNSFKLTIVFGIIFGFGLVTKISFFPVLLIPLFLIKRISYKFYFLAITAIVFCLLLTPVISFDQIFKFAAWIKSITTNSGLYGMGNPEIIDTSSFFGNLKKILINELMFTISYVLAFTTLILYFIPRFRIQIRENKYFNLLTGIFFAMSVQLIIVSKHFTFRYMLPALMLSVLSFYVVLNLTSGILPEYLKRKKKLIFSTAFLIFLFFSLKTFYTKTSDLYFKQNESHRILNFLDENYKHSIIISTNLSSSIEAALHLGARYSGSQREKYYTVINSLYPDRYIFNIWYKVTELMDKDFLRTLLIEKNKFFFDCKSTIELNDFILFISQLTGSENITYKEVYSNKREEKIYEIELNP
ncbi:MAG TPA: hypothetical protein PK294_05595 [Ignavibacteria bacterium]|nr:hypothetical protein [Ignavibacteria bacterium]